MAEVLAAHQPTSKLLSPSDVRMACLCGRYAQDDELPTFHNSWIIAHQAAALTAAGFVLGEEAKAEAWARGAEAAWARSTPIVNAQNYQWRHEGEPRNPYHATTEGSRNDRP